LLNNNSEKAHNEVDENHEIFNMPYQNLFVNFVFFVVKKKKLNG